MSIRRRESLLGAFYYLLVLTLLVGCAEGESLNQPNPDLDASEAKKHVFDVNAYSLNNLVCDPFGGQPENGGYGKGIQAKLFYLADGQSPFHRVSDYINKGIASEKDLFFSEINVPTRLFDEGFPTENGDLVKKDTGDTLVEYFALRFESTLKLGPDDEEGVYEVALLSDDGTILSILDPVSGSTQLIVDNDGTHPTRMGCGSNDLLMDKDTRFDIQLDYYQGPRNHIAVLPLWRKKSADTSDEPLCGVQGNKKFFDYNNNSEPQQAYKDLLARGWKPLTQENYDIPDQANYNPCVQGTPPMISNLEVSFDPDAGLAVTWQTELLATSQVIYINEDTGEQNVTVSDNILRKSHRVPLSGLVQGESYILQAVSISEDLGKSIAEIRIQN